MIPLRRNLINYRLSRLTAALALLGMTACSTINNAALPSQPADALFQRLSSYCGKAFAGRLVSDEVVDADMAGMPLIMHVRTCTKSEIRIPLHVGTRDESWDRSRTWIITRTGTGLRLKHDHRHANGSDDKVTMYGGDTNDVGTPARQEFTVDQESIDLFNKEGLPRSITNVWAVEVSATDSASPVFAYELRRSGENARYFRVEFDLRSHVEPPPAPWGHP